MGSDAKRLMGPLAKRYAVIGAVLAVGVLLLGMSGCASRPLLVDGGAPQAAGGAITVPPPAPAPIVVRPATAAELAERSKQLANAKASYRKLMKTVAELINGANAAAATEASADQSAPALGDELRAVQLDAIQQGEELNTKFGERCKQIGIWQEHSDELSEAPLRVIAGSMCSEVSRLQEQLGELAQNPSVALQAAVDRAAAR